MTLSDVCKFIVDCPHSTAEDEGKGVPLIRTPNIGKGRFVFEGVHRVSESIYRKRCARATPQDDDIIFAREAPAGNAAIIKGRQKMCLGQRTVLIRPDATKVIPDYLVYYLLAPEQQYKLLGTANGATVAHVNLPTIREMKVDNLPPLGEQRRIADILSAYDDLIENNRKQIKLLEEAARRLYKEWFIDLRFPGHEHTPIINGIPQGWKKTSIEGMLRYYIGGGWGKETASAKNVCCGAVIRGTDINDIKSGDFANLPMRFHTREDIVKRELAPGDIVLELSNGNIDNIGRCLLIDERILALCGENTICASFCKLLRPFDKKCSVLLFLEILTMQADGRLEPLKKHGSNGINNFDFEGFLNHELLLPLADDFDLSPFENSLDKISTCRSIISRITEARNRLLPKLMNKEIEE